MALLVSILGFGLTVWTILETRRATTAAQVKLQNEIDKTRQETKDLVKRIRLKSLENACEQAFFFASEARHAIRSMQWLRAAERCSDARQLASRLPYFPELTDAERTPLRAAVEDLKSVAAFIEKNRKPGAVTELQADKVAPVDGLLDAVGAIRNRPQQLQLEPPNANDNS